MNTKLIFIQISILVILILLNAFFAASEVALISLKPGQIRKITRTKGKRGRLVKKLLSNTGRFLATVQVGVTFSGFMASAFAAESFADPLAEYFYARGFQYFSIETLEAGLVVITTFILSYLSLIFGELVPKQLGIRHAEKVALLIAYPIEIISRFTAPFVWILSFSVSLVMKLFGKNATDEETVTEEEIRSLIDLGEEKGILEKKEHEMIHNVLSFNDKTAGELMTHRRDVSALDLAMPEDEIESYLLSVDHSRIPVYSGTIDNITGVLYLREYFGKKLRGEPVVLKELIKEVYYAPENMLAGKLFDEMQKRKLTFSVLLDEFGGTAGIIAVSDILESIVGTIQDEFAPDKEIRIRKLNSGEWIIDGAEKLSQIYRKTGCQLPTGKYDTLSGMILTHLKTLPETGTVLKLKNRNIRLEVKSIEGCLPKEVLLTDLDSLN